MSYQDGLEDEVERLRAEMERLRGDFQCCADVGRRMEAEVEGLRAENAALDAVAEGRAADRRAAEAEVERLRAERDEARAQCERQVSRAGMSHVAAERDRLRAVLATTRENVEALVQSVGERYITEAAVCTILAAFRARAGEPTPADPRPLREIVHAGEPSADGVFFVDLICGHRIATRQRQGEYPCLYCGSGERRRPAP